VLADERTEAVQDLSAGRGGNEPPVLVGDLGGLDRPVDVGGSARREDPDQLAGGGAEALERLARDGIDPPRRR